MDDHSENRITGSARGAGWERMFAAAERYYRAHGDLDVPSNYVTPAGEKLGAWLVRQRGVRAGKLRGSLSPERVRRLDAIGMSWRDLAEERWERNFAALCAYYERFGNLDVPQTYVTPEGIHLGQFVKNMRFHKDTKYRRCLTPSRVIMLTEMGMIWDMSEHRWSQGYAHAREYFATHGDLRLTKRTLAPDGFKLGMWLTYQRGKRAKGELEPEKIAKLDEIGMIW